METWAQVKHRHVVSLLGFCTDLGPVPCFVSPWIENGTATNFIARNPDADRVKLVRVYFARFWFTLIIREQLGERAS